MAIPGLVSTSILAFLLAWMPFAHAGQILTVIYPSYESKLDTRFQDLIEILTLSLEKTVATYGPYALKESDLPMNEQRYWVELRGGQKVNVIWSSTSVSKEEEFLPIRIPLRKGLLGYRIALIDARRQGDIDHIKTIEDLRKFRIGQGFGWGDVALYEANGISVTQADYDNLFSMVAADRFDLFPRGVAEAYQEFEQRRNSVAKLAIEQHLLIYYPWPYYFFFNKRDNALKERVEHGLRLMLADGSFDKIFRKYNARAIESANLGGRRIIRLRNHDLPPATPLDDASLWYTPENFNARQ